VILTENPMEWWNHGVTGIDTGAGTIAGSAFLHGDPLLAQQ
jgi:hypothetical protein